jgi:hypothetical protein
MDRPPNPGGSVIADSNEPHTCSCASRDRFVMLGWIDPYAGACSETCVCATVHILKQYVAHALASWNSRARTCKAHLWCVLTEDQTDAHMKLEFCEFGQAAERLV